MHDITYALRTFGREQLNATLACIYAIGRPGEILLAEDASTVLSPATKTLIECMKTAGWVFHVAEVYQRGSGFALESLLNLVYQDATSEYVLFVDDDLLFTREHIETLMNSARESGIATFAPRDPDVGFTAHVTEHCRQYPLSDQYFTLVNRAALSIIPLESWLPMAKMDGVTDLVFFSKVLELVGGLKPNVLLDDERPLHLFVIDEPHKWWARVDYKLWDQWVSEVYDQADIDLVAVQLQGYNDLLAEVAKASRNW